MKKRSHPLGARIKRLMQADDDVGKIASATPNLIGRAVELFLQKLCQSALSVAQSRQARTLTPAHLKAYVHSDKLMDFLKDTVSSAPDLGAEGDAASGPKLKRQRTLDSPEAAASLPAARGRGRPASRGQPKGRVNQPRTTTDSDSELSDSPHNSPSAHPQSSTSHHPHPNHKPSPFFPSPAAGSEHSSQPKSSLLSSLPSARRGNPPSHPTGSTTARSNLGQTHHAQPHASSSHQQQGPSRSHPHSHPSSHPPHPDSKPTSSALPVPAPVPAPVAAVDGGTEGSGEKAAPLPVQVSASALSGYQGGVKNNDYDDDYDDDYDS